MAFIMIAYTESKGWGVKCAWKEGSKLYKDNVGTPLWHFRTGTCSVPPFSLFRLKSIHNARKPQKSNSYRTIDANYADILVSLAIKSHFTESVRWYEDRISFPNQCAFPNSFWDGKREINLQSSPTGAEYT